MPMNGSNVPEKIVQGSASSEMPDDGASWSRLVALRAAVPEKLFNDAEIPLVFNATGRFENA
jgi:hypothetical protein